MARRGYRKYGAVKTSIDGIEFDSKKEAIRYTELKLLERAGEIKDLKLQPKFVLQEGFRLDGVSHRASSYVADFMYLTKDGKTIVEDTKGVKTDVYRLKKKLFLKKYLAIEDRKIDKFIES